MKKTAIFFTIFLLLFQFSFGQEDEGEIGGRNIFVALSPSTSALIGFQGGILSNGDGIIGGDGFIDPLGFYIAARYNNRNIMNLDRLSVTLGVAPQLTNFLYIYGGGGYGTYKYPFLKPTLLPDQEIKGFEADGGLIIKVWRVTVSGGVSILDFSHTDYTVGVGFTF